MTTKDMQTVSAFWRSFNVDPLYNCGFSDAVQGSGATDIKCHGDMLKANAYLLSYANACRLACVYMTRRWQIAELLGIAAGMFLAVTEESPAVRPSARDDVARLCQQYTRELVALLDSDTFANPRL